MKKNSISLLNALITTPISFLGSGFVFTTVLIAGTKKEFNINFSNLNNFHIRNIWKNEINEDWIKEELFNNRDKIFVNLNVNSIDEMKKIINISNINFDKFAIGIINFDCELNVDGFHLNKKIYFNIHFNDIVLNNARNLTKPHSKFTSINKTNEIINYYNNYPNTINENEYFLRFVYSVQKLKSDINDNDINNTINLIKNNVNDVNRMTKIVELLIDIKLPINSLLYNKDDPEVHNNVKEVMKKVLDDFFTNYYYKDQSYIGNWWNYDIGVPRRLVPILPFLVSYYPFNDVLKWVDIILWHTRNYENWTGGNLLDYTYLRAMSFIAINQISKAKEIVDYTITKIFGGWKDVTYENIIENGYSFYRDGSYLDHDDVPYFGGYGVVLLDGLDKLRHMFQNSIYEIQTNKNLENFYKIIETTIMPYFYDGVYSDSLGGRTITRSSYLSERKNGMKILSLVSNFVSPAPSEYKDRLINFVLNNLDSDVIEQYMDDNLKSFKNNYHEKVKIQNRNIKTTWEELNYFNNSDVSFGYDAFINNNKMWFSKNQDRFSIQRDNFMMNISLSSTRTKNFEMINKENIFGYYFSNGRTLINNKNNESYDWEYNLGVDPFKIPGTSSVYEFDNQNMSNNDIESRFNDYYSIARKTNKGFSNGISLDGFGLISANISNYNEKYELWTKKNYIVIDDVILVVGDVDKSNIIDTTKNTNLNVYTTIANEREDFLFTEKIVNINNKNYNKYSSKSKNSYYVLDNQESIVNVNKTRNMNNQTTNLTNKPGNTSFTFSELYFDHSKNNNKKFAYAIAPNEISEEKTLNVLNNIKYQIENNYIIIEYSKGDSKYYFISTKENNQNITLDNISFIFENKTSFILEKNNNKFRMIMSPNENVENYKIKLNNNISNIIVKNNNEVQYLGGYITIDNKKNKFNDILHNSWIQFTLD